MPFDMSMARSAQEEDVIGLANYLLQDLGSDFSMQLWTEPSSMKISLYYQKPENVNIYFGAAGAQYFFHLPDRHPRYLLHMQQLQEAIFGMLIDRGIMR